MTPEQQAYLLERQGILEAGAALSVLISSAGWQVLLDFQKTQLVRKRHDMFQVTTDDPVKAMDALRRWQLAEEFFTQQNGYIDNMIGHAVEISGTRTVEEALLTEKLHEQSQSAEPGTTDPAGY